ncbi:MAG: 2-oxo acid dehydrogenase subunit E2 [Chloroflexi bacterium]|nr:2-oxo acid dehydrogenase subunit E2 [Chloroflexota bacterium]
MPIKVELPQVGESVTEGIIQKWLKKPGDVVQKYEPLVEVVTDKVTMEMPSPVGGTLVSLLVQEGTKVAMGTPICEIETGDVAPAAVAPAEAAPAARAPTSTVGVFVEATGHIGPTGAIPSEEAGPSVEAPATLPEGPTPAAPRAPLRLSPVVQRLAAEHGITEEEMRRLRGTGIEGRITKQDLLGYIERKPATGAAPAAAPFQGRAAPPAPAPAAQAAPALEEEVLPLTPVRRIIAENMVKAAQIPVAWSANEVDATSLVRLRGRVRDEFERREGVELTYLPFIAKAVVEALREHPLLNSAWGGDKIILKKRINLGIAVAAAQGLVVPVVRDADRLSIAGLAHAFHRLIEKARKNQLTLEDVQGGTFTLNNTGALGSFVSQAIINYPQAAIMTTESITKRPVVVSDAIAIRDIMYITMSFDHRILDGQAAGGFVQAVKRRIEAMGPDTPVY